MGKPEEESPTRNNLSDLLPYLSEGFCSGCKALLQNRIQNLNLNTDGGISLPNDTTTQEFCSSDSSSFWTPEKSPASSTQTSNSSPSSVTSSQTTVSSKLGTEYEFSKLSLNGSNGRLSSDGKSLIPSEEHKSMSQVGRKKDFYCGERINGKAINVLQGLELHTKVFNADEQKKIVDYVYDLQRMGQSRKLRDRTYSEPRKWMRGKGRVTIQFGCCYNYAVDKNGNPPGIIRDEEVDPIPSLLKSMIKRMVRWHVLPPTCIPNSCIVNIYDEGDCIPPHIDHHDFVRPFCTVSFLTEANILFGANLKVVAPGEFSGPASIPLPPGSVLILKGNGADLAKHCVPAVPGKRISITFRKMDDSKLPFNFSPDPDLQGIQPLPLGTSQMNTPVQQVPQLPNMSHHSGSSISPVKFGETDFPPLGASSAVNRPRSRK